MCTHATSLNQEHSCSLGDRTMTRFLDIPCRHARLAILAIALSAVSASFGPLDAQESRRASAVDNHEPGVGRFVIRPFFGAYLPTGDDRDFLKDAALFGAQASWNPSSSIGITTSVGFVSVEEEASIIGQEIDAVHYDIGLEVRSDRVTLGPVTPF